jgi:hypothetical protein
MPSREWSLCCLSIHVGFSHDPQARFFVFLFSNSCAVPVPPSSGEPTAGMRLLDTQTLQLSEFFEDSVPEYAILSHTWDRDEVTHQHIQSLDVARGMQGFAKVEGACRLAAREGFKYIWIDTCCIDKSSSAELSEAINSMYSWYQKSTKCYAYLADVNHLNFPNDTTEFAASRWFERGWTLQELIAPSQVVFLSHDWTRLGTKSELRGLVSRITGIDTGILAGGDHHFVCVARKMFWASRRQTTRVEDMAYCLLGLFSVNMPLMYGEGKSAFIRLQKKIIKLYDDQSIFAWTLPVEESNMHQLYGLLAESPAAFKDTGKAISPFQRKHPGRQTTRVMSTGVEIDLLLQPPTSLFVRLKDSTALSLFLYSLLFPFIMAPRITLIIILIAYLLAFVTIASVIFIQLVVLKVRGAKNNAGPDDCLESSRSERINHYRAALDCQLINPLGSSQHRPCLEIVALEPPNSANHSSFARINVSKLEGEDLSLYVISPTFKNGIRSKSFRNWPLIRFSKFAWL